MDDYVKCKKMYKNNCEKELEECKKRQSNNKSPECSDINCYGVYLACKVVNPIANMLCEIKYNPLFPFPLP
jgi:hypothetical protein